MQFNQEEDDSASTKIYLWSAKVESLQFPINLD